MGNGSRITLNSPPPLHPSSGFHPIPPKSNIFHPKYLAIFDYFKKKSWFSCSVIWPHSASLPVNLKSSLFTAVPPSRDSSSFIHTPQLQLYTFSLASSVRAATLQAKMLSRRYRSCWLRRHWTDESGACRLPDCGQVPGVIGHLLSAECPALQPHLATTLPHLFAMLSPNKDLLSLLVSAVSCNDKVTTASFFLDPSTNPKVIALVQRYGKGPVLGPLFRVSRAWIWSAHRARMRLLGLERFLLF